MMPRRRGKRSGRSCERGTRDSQRMLGALGMLLDATRLGWSNAPPTQTSDACEEDPRVFCCDWIGSTSRRRRGQGRVEGSPATSKACARQHRRQRFPSLAQPPQHDANKSAWTY